MAKFITNLKRNYRSNSFIFEILTKCEFLHNFILFLSYYLEIKTQMHIIISPFFQMTNNEQNQLKIIKYHLNSHTVHGVHLNIVCIVDITLHLRVDINRILELLFG